MYLRQRFPRAWSTGKLLVFWNLLEMRAEEPSVCSGRMALAFQSPEIHAALCPRPDSSEHCKKQSDGGAGVEVPSHSLPSSLPSVGTYWSSPSLAMLPASPQCPGPALQDVPLSGRVSSLQVGWIESCFGVLQ